MIVVIADDLSGAAELAGAAASHGLTAEVQTQWTPAANADVVCLDTDTRSLRALEAANVVERLASAVGAVQPGWVYKKCDSVLRGNVLAEIRAIMAGAGKPSAILISANPKRGRIIRGGEYLVEGRPLDQTAFGADPEHPRRTSRIADLLGGSLKGVQTPDVESTADLDRHAKGVSSSTLPAGGVEFFEALLHVRCPAGAQAQAAPFQPRPGERTLFVCGSAAAWTKGREGQAAAHATAVIPMPEALLGKQLDPDGIAQWASDLAAGLDRGSVMAAIARTELRHDAAPAELAERLADAVARAVRRTRVRRVCAEGGATAAAVGRALNWTRFAVAGQLAGGVVALRPHAARETEFVIKVGSYDWPAEIWPR